MRRRRASRLGRWLVSGAALIAGCSVSPPRGTPSPSPIPPAAEQNLSDAVEPEAVLRAMALVAGWQLAHRPLYRPHEWPIAVWMAGLAAFAPISEDPERCLDAIRRNGEESAWKSGPRPFHADDHAITQSYFLLHRLEPDRRMIEPALRLFEEMLRRPFDEPLDFHPEKRAREWVWCDALFMSPPALALAAEATGDRRYVDLMSRLWWKTTDYLYDREDHLYYRDSRFFDRREANGKKVFWSRGNGWALAGLARVLQYLPPDDPERPRFVALFQEMAEKVASLQDPAGYWPTGLLDPASHPEPETSGTALFTYALGWGVNEGLLENAAHESAVRRGWSALVRAIRPVGKLGYVQPVGDAPGEASPDRTEVYGSGAFLLAGSEVYRLAQRLRPSSP
jgi:rhamnogalacturonyl hydrolase YesR